jgi:AGZA family xanthine/uracil permease-like MFS transporter
VDYLLPNFLPGAEIRIYPVIAPALIIVGSMMAKSVLKIDWDDPTEYIPAFITIIIMPVTFNIALGIGFGFIAYTLLKLVTGRLKDGSLFIYVFAGLFLVFFVVMYVPGLRALLMP